MFCTECGTKLYDTATVCAGCGTRAPGASRRTSSGMASSSPFQTERCRAASAMEKFCRAFRHRHVVLPVVHVTSLEQTLRNVSIAYDAGSDGVFLINHAVAMRYCSGSTVGSLTSIRTGGSE